ncbi:MAG: SRPBCC family protein [Cyanobacteria bacterium P01_F01_bin.150]
MKKIVLGTAVSVLSLGIVLAAGYSIFSRCHPSSAYLLPTSGEREVVMTPSSPLRASTQIYLNRPVEEVFDYLSNSSSLPQWMPGLVSVTYEHGDSAVPGSLAQGSQRTMMFGEQMETETIVQYKRPHVIAYQITAGVPLKNHLAVMMVEPDGDDDSLLTWHQYFDLDRSSIYGWLMPFLVRRFLNDAEVQLVNTFGGEFGATCQYGPL